MRIGDLVSDNSPNAWANAATYGAGFKFGIILDCCPPSHFSARNKEFRVLWRDGTIGENVWDYDLKVVNESR